MTNIEPSTRHEFVLLFDVRDGNPNGDPDMDNMPRVDPETRQGMITDVALKRKVRDYVHGVLGIPVFIQSRQALNTLIEEAGAKRGVGESKTVSRDVREELIRTYYDIRMFGAVLSTGKLNAGQVRGPVQLTFGRSIDPVLQHSLTITRQAKTRQEDFEKSGAQEMGRKSIVPYGLYRAHGYFNPFLAEQVSEEDLQVFFEALQNMFEFDRSAARGEMAVRGLYLFTHEDKKGNAPAHRLFEGIRVERVGSGQAPRSFNDYRVSVDEVSPGIELKVLVEA